MSSFLFALLLGALLAMGVAGGLAASLDPRLGAFARVWRSVIGDVLLLAMAAGVADAAWVLGQGPMLLPAHSVTSLFSFDFALDRLSSFFLLLITGVALAVLLFARTSLERRYSGRRLDLLWTLLAFFLLAMIVVVSASNAFTFMLGWELMSLTSGALILLEGDSPQRRRTVLVYLVVMHIGAVAVMSAFFLFLPHAPNLSFQSIRAEHGHLPAAISAAIVLLALFGFGTKAGIVPLHGTLPGADASAPLPVATLMSAVLLKTAVYGLIRLLFDLLGGGPVWGGTLLLLGGAASALLGTLLALAERDVRRVLAYSGIENIGVILMALGAALIFEREGAVIWAGMALAAGLFHALHHAVAKGLVFLGSGTVHQATGSPMIDDWGGLMGRMPRTGAAMLAGCAALAGLPLFGGFVGEWMLFRSLIAGSQLPSALLRATLPLLAGVLALAGGLALAVCTNLYGMAFLGRPRTPGAAAAEPAPLGESSGMLALALVSLALGVFPWLGLKPIFLVVADLIPGAVVPAFVGITEHALPWLGVVLLLVVTIAWIWRVKSGAAAEAASAWACGAPGLSPRMEYSSSAFTKPIRMVFRPVYRPARKVAMTPAVEGPSGRYFPAAISYRSIATDSFERYLVRPSAWLVFAVARQIRRLQSGSLQQYLLYIFLTLIGLLVFMRGLA